MIRTLYYIYIFSTSSALAEAIGAYVSVISVKTRAWCLQCGKEWSSMLRAIEGKHFGSGNVAWSDEARALVDPTQSKHWLRIQKAVGSPYLSVRRAERGVGSWYILRMQQDERMASMKI